MKIALFAGGSFYGDVGPFIEIARRLESLGHKTVLVLPEEYSDKTKDFTCCYYMGDVLPKELEHNASSYERMIYGIFENLLQNAFDRIDNVIEACKDVDVILSHPLCAISGIVSDYYNIKNVELLISSMYFDETETRTKFLNDIGLTALNECRKKLNLNVATNVSMDIFSNNNTKITLFPKFYVSTNNSSVVYGNFIHYEECNDLPADLLDFINAGSPPVVFAMGSGSEHMMNPSNFNEITVEVAKKYRSILLGKSDVRHDNIFVCDFPLPHSKLFPLASMVVTHGGIGTIGKCLASNTPQIAVPQMAENKGNAELLANLITVIDPNNYNIETISTAIEKCHYNFELGEYYSSVVNSINVIDIIDETINS